MSTGRLTPLKTWKSIKQPVSGQTLWLWGRAHRDVQFRSYEVKVPSDQRGYRSVTSACEMFWTVDDRGPNGEQVVEHRRYIVVADGGFLCSARDWEEVIGFFRLARFELVAWYIL